MIFFFSSRRRHTRYWRDWSSDVCSSDLVDILEVLPPTGPGEQWGYTGIFSKQNGGGFLTDVYPEAHKAIWDLPGLYATSRHVPDVGFVGVRHPGLIGCAPFHDLLARGDRREDRKSGG